MGKVNAVEDAERNAHHRTVAIRIGGVFGGGEEIRGVAGVGLDDQAAQGDPCRALAFDRLKLLFQFGDFAVGEFARALTPDLDSAYLGGPARWRAVRALLRAYWLVVLALLPDRSRVAPSA